MLQVENIPLYLQPLVMELNLHKAQTEGVSAETSVDICFLCTVMP